MLSPVSSTLQCLEGAHPLIQSKGKADRKGVQATKSMEYNFSDNKSWAEKSLCVFGKEGKWRITNTILTCYTHRTFLREGAVANSFIDSVFYTLDPNVLATAKESERTIPVTNLF